MATLKSRESWYIQEGFAPEPSPTEQEVAELKQVGVDLAKAAPEVWPSAARAVKKIEACRARVNQQVTEEWRRENPDLANGPHEAAIRDEVIAWEGHAPATFSDPESLLPIRETVESAASIATRHYRRKHAGEVSGLNPDETLQEMIHQRNAQRQGRR